MAARRDDQYGGNGSDRMTNDTDFGTNDSRKGIKGIKSQPWFQRLLRVTQALSAIISLALFSSRVAKVIRLTGKLSRSSGAVEGMICFFKSVHLHRLALLTL